MVSRRQLLKLSALGVGSLLLREAFSASRISTPAAAGSATDSALAAGFPDGGGSKNLLDAGATPSYPDIRGIPGKSWRGVEGIYVSDQARLQSELDTYQAERISELNDFLKSRGFEVPLDYAPGIEIFRGTQVLRVNAELYRAKDAGLPFVTSNWAVDATRFLEVGDAAFLQETVKRGSGMTGLVGTRSPVYLKTVSDIINRVPVSVLRLVPKLMQSALHAGGGTFALAAPINGLISDMNSVGGGQIVLTNGKHMLESYIQLLSNVAVIGAGDNSVFKGMFSRPINRMISSPAAVLQHNIKLQGFSVDRSSLNTQHGIILGGVDGLTIDGVTVDGFCPGVNSGAIGISPFDEFAAVQSRNVSVKNCRINRSNNFGIAFGNVSRGTLSKNIFTDAWREAIGLECWGNSSVVEDILVSENMLHMSTSLSNHHGGSIGPAILVGGAGQSYGGATRRCVLKGNIITIDNPEDMQAYNGIVIVGGNSDAYAAEDIELEDNSIYSAPAQAISIGALGSVQRRITSRGNKIVNPNGSDKGYSAIQLRNAQDCLFQGDVIVGSKHAYAVFEDVGSMDNKYIDIVPGAPIVGKFHRSSAVSVFQ